MNPTNLDITSIAEVWFNEFFILVVAANTLANWVMKPKKKATDGFSKFSGWNTTYMHMLIPFLIVITLPKCIVKTTKYKVRFKKGSLQSPLLLNSG